MFSYDWIASRFGSGDWLGAGMYGEAWRIPYEGQVATIKLTNSAAEAFCVERIKEIQSSIPYDPLFPFPYIFDSGPITEIEYDSDWYEKAEGAPLAPLDYPDYLYIREYAEPLAGNIPLEQLQERGHQIQLKYGLYLMDIASDNWGVVQRGDIDVIVPLDLACGDEENWWNESWQTQKEPFENPDWWEEYVEGW